MTKPDDKFISALSDSFDLSAELLVSKTKVLEALATRINQLLSGNPDKLFSLLYRLDISEQKIKTALGHAENIPLQLAELVYNRQLEKAASRKRFRQEKPDDELSL